MDLAHYQTLRARSRGLFGNALVLPIADAVAENVTVGSDFTAPDVRSWVSGRAADNQIHDALTRLASTGAIDQLPYPGRPHPRRWERADHPLWLFVAEWGKIPARN